jgi:hypothetical protein
MITKKDIETLKETFVTKRDLAKTKKEIIQAISNISVNSPTINQFNTLETRVTKLETSIN